MTILREWLAPGLSWAFPRGSHHQLILAAIGNDPQTSLEAAHQWLSANDIDDATFRDHRLLLAIIARFGRELESHSAYPRLIGLQRMLWTRSMMAMQESRPSLAKIANSGHEILLIKGASRLAMGGSTVSKQRVAYDIDFVVRPESIAPVFDILVEDKWVPSPGTSCEYIREHLSSTRSINLFKGNWGDIDLHSRPFHPGQGGCIEDSLIWVNAQPATLRGVPVRVPQAEDRVALAIAHGGLDGHSHSDWLVDCSAIVRYEEIDWQRSYDVILSRQIAVPAAVTFAYFKQELGFDVPDDFLREVTKSATSHVPKMYSGLIQVRPKDRSGPLGQVMRAIAKKHRKFSGSRHMPAKSRDRELVVRRVAAANTFDPGPFVKSYRLMSSSECDDKPKFDVDIVLDIQPPRSRRRIEMEINSADAHLCRARFCKWARNDGPLRLRLSGTIHNPTANSAIELVSRPSRQLRSFASESEKERYESLAFRVVSCHIS